MRAYPFIEGVTLSNAVPANSTQIFYDLGKSLAKLHKKLEVNIHMIYVCSFNKDTVILHSKTAFPVVTTLHCDCIVTTLPITSLLWSDSYKNSLKSSTRLEGKKSRSFSAKK